MGKFQLRRCSGAGRARHPEMMKMINYEIQGDPTLRTYARALDASDDYRVLRRLPRPAELWLMSTPTAGPDFVLGVIDCETTGLGDDAKVIEIAVLKMHLVDGMLADITAPMAMVEDPGEPLSNDIVQLTGLRDRDVRGQRFHEELLAHTLGACDALIAYNARFDCGHLQRRFPTLCHGWICAREDFDWQLAGYGQRSQQGLVTELGHFYEAHRASADIWALAMLIATPAADGRTIAAHMIDAGRSVEMRIAASGAPFGVKDALRARGHRWNAASRVWFIDVAPDHADAEIAALKALHPLIKPTVTEIDWYNRYSS